MGEALRRGMSDMGITRDQVCEQRRDLIKGSAHAGGPMMGHGT